MKNFKLLIASFIHSNKIWTAFNLLSIIYSYLTTVCLFSILTSPASSYSFNEVFYFEIEENSKPGSFVGKIPTKPGFSYRFNDDPLEFSLDSQSGTILTTSSLLDRESKDFYNLIVLSSSPTYPIEVKIKILDINDNAPFWPSYINRNVSFSESAPIGTKLIIEPAIDLDEGHLVYEIIETVSSSPKIDKNFKVYNQFLDKLDSSNFQPTSSFPFRLNYNTSSSFLHLEVSDNLDRETQANYVLNISATDQKGLQAFLVLFVQILDVNDNPPIFDHSDYSVSLNESVGKGVSILQVRATDSDEEGNLNSAISYYLLSEKYFTIDSVTGVVYTAQDGSIDCGTPGLGANFEYRVCVFTVFAHDHGTPRQNGRAYVTINLVDSNDHDPQIKFRYLSKSDQASVDENAANGSVVTAVSVVDLDHGPNGETSLSIIDGNQLGHFRLESISSSHIIRVNGSLDREKVSKYNLTIIAKDHGSPSRSSTANLIITVNDINDHEPIFNRELYEVSLTESLPIGSFVTSVSAIDLDEGINANLYYSLSGPNAHFFKIDIITGLVTTEKVINREENELFELRVMARDGGPNPKWAYASLKINILDINDEVPTLILPKAIKYDEKLEANVYEVEENTKVSIELTTIDKDQGANGTVDVSLLHSYNDLFQIDQSLSTPRLVSTQELNYEVCNEFKLSIIVKDQAHPNYQLSSTIFLIIKVLDRDDHLPLIYPINYFAFIPFNFSSLNYSIVVSRVLTRDADVLSPISFEIQPQTSQSSIFFQLFHFNQKTGEVNLKIGTQINLQALPNLFKFDIFCQSCEQSSNKAKFHIYVIHPNSRNKVIDSIKREYMFEISESASIGSIIGKIDINIVKFKLIIVSGDPNGQFIIDGFYLKINRHLDREVFSFYKLQLIAYNDEAFVQIDVKINIIDVNDNHPFFSEKFVEFVIPIDVPPKLTVYFFKTFDPDLIVSKTSTNSSNLPKVKYELVINPQNILMIENNELKINRSLSELYSERLNVRKNNIIDVIQIEVKATDLEAVASVVTPLLHSNCHLNNHLFIYLHIQNINKHKPRFKSSFYEMNLSESIAVNSQFLKISANDDNGDDIEYKIVEGNFDEAFGIFPDGSLYIKTSLDREKFDAYSLKIVAFENKIRSKSTKHLESSLNYVSIDEKAYQAYFYSQIFCQVIINVIDENDHAPLFENHLFHYKITENSGLNTLIGQVTATDADKGANSEVNYALIESNFSKMVEINPQSGHLWSKVVFDAEKISHLQLEVIAFDQSFDSNRLTSTATVIIDILDVNDNSPKFISSEEDGLIFSSEVREEYVIESIALSEDTQKGTKLLTLRATDADANSKILYKMLDSPQTSYFHLNSTTGELRLAQLIDRETINLVEVLVSANDGHFEAYKLLRFIIEDVNDNAPYFINFTLNEITVSEDVKVGSVILSLFAIDPDLGANGQFKFDITHFSNGPNKRKTFDILKNFLIVSNALDFETDPIHYLNISAVDTFGLKSEIKLLKVVILDVNDCVPTFQTNLNPSLDLIKIQENIKKGSKLMTVQAFDCDKDDELSYEIGNCNIFQDSKKRLNPEYHFNNFEVNRFGKNCPISINPTNGDLVTTSTLDRELAETIQLQIIVRDQVSHIEKKQVTIILEDINDNYPIFVSPNAIVLFGSQVEENQMLGIISATDADAGINSMVTYKLDSESSELFNLNFETGQLKARESLDMRIQRTMTVTATDGAGLVTSDKLTFILIPRSRYLNQIQVSDLTLEIYENEPFGVLLHKFKCLSQENLEKCEFFINKAKDRTFAIDQYSGDLYLKSRLDREYSDYHNLELISIQGIQVHIYKVTIRVLDRNDNPPVFDFHTSAIFVSEATSIGTEIFDISEATKDMDAESQLEYKLINCSHCVDNTFRVDSFSGKIFLKEPLDREYISKYHLIIGVSDSIHFTTGHLDITVTDINDNPPRFNQSYYSFDILENTERGVVVGKIHAIDLDDFSHLITYLIISEQNSDDSVFSLNEKTGEFTLTRHLDYENDPIYYIITCQAFDGNFKSEKINVYFNLINLNDNWPVFDPISYRVELFENSTVGTEILCVSATDSDFYQYYDGLEDNNTNIKYYFQTAKEIFNVDAKSSTIYQFKISKKSGCIQLVEELDRETISHYDLTIIASDDYFKATANLQIKVKDVNDNEPQFNLESPLVLNVPENLSPFSIISSFKAYDKDEAPNNYIQYELKHDGKDIYNQNFPFSIGSIDGLLRLVGKLDRETIDTYHFIIQAKDYGLKSSEIKVTVQVTDVNDNTPQFEQNEFHLKIPENISKDSPILKFLSTDLDKPDKINYRIVSGDINGQFKIVDDELLVVMALDYEKISSYDLQVQAIDKGNNFDTARVVIDILNVHDEAPQFLNSPYFLNWCENEVGILGQFQAVGELYEGTKQSHLNYLLKNNHDQYFDLNSTNALLNIIKPIDREALGENSIIEMRIVAIDKRLPRLTGEGILLINIIDVNDNKPSFSKEHYVFNLLENHIYYSKESFGKVEAHDSDSFDKILYKILENEFKIFKINEKTGELFFQSDMIFDRELKPEYEINVEAKDSKYKVVTKVTIIIMDVNDCKPLFKSVNGQPLTKTQQVNFNLRIQQQMIKATKDLFVAGFHVEDCDEESTLNSKVKFDLIANKESQSLFYINSDTGVLQAHRAFDQNEFLNITHQLKIIAHDMSPNDPLNSILNLEITIVHNPFFKFKRIAEIVQKISVSELAKVNKTIHKFQLLSSLDNKVDLSIIGGDSSQNFKIVQNLLLINKRLDYEKLKFYDLYIYINQKIGEDFEFEIMKVKIEVINENDNYPTFDFDVYNATIPEEVEESLMVIQLFANDKDLHDDDSLEDKLRYFIVSPFDSPFRIDEKYGTIWTTSKVDREIESKYNLIVEVKDEGNLTGYCTVLVTVEDKNDNPPRFTRLFSVNVTENSPIGTKVIQATSIDKDFGIFAQATYSFIEPSDVFEIEPNSGEVFVIGNLDREVKDEYLLMVSANDKSWKAQTTLTVSVLDENDNWPVFEKDLYEFRCKMSFETDIIGEVRATDIDKGQNSLISYSFKHTSEYFAIDPFTGIIRLKSFAYLKLTYNSNLECLNQHNLTVIASDHGIISKSKETIVLITIFSNQETTQSLNKVMTKKIPIPYNLKNGTILYEHNQHLVVDFINSNQIIEIDDSTVIYKGKNLVKRGDEFTFKLESVSSELDLTLTILDSNNYSPQFVNNTSQVVVTENEDINNVLLQIKAIDNDMDPYNNELTYDFRVIEWQWNERALEYFQKTSKNIIDPYFINLPISHLLNQTYQRAIILNPFRIDSLNGILLLNYTLDYELITGYKLEIIAKDKSWFDSKSSSMTITVHVTDVNDNKPIFKNIKNGNIIMEVYENNPVGFIIGKVEATDFDSLRYSQIIFEIVNELDYKMFSINPKTGLIRALISFDYEQKRDYQFKVLAKNDKKVSSMATIDVKIKNVNEFKPRFKNQHLVFDVFESSPVGTILGSLKNSVTDEDYNEPVYFYLIKNKNFGIDIDRNGTIRIVEKIDFSEIAKYDEIIFPVIAKNLGPIKTNKDYDEAQIVFSLGGVNGVFKYNQTNYICKLGLVIDNALCNEDASKGNPDPMSIGLILVILFFVILILVLSTSFLIFHNQKTKQMQNCPNHTRKINIKHHFAHQINGNSSHLSSFVHSPVHNLSTLCSQQTGPPPPPPLNKQQPPDIIESPSLAPTITSRAPPAPPFSFVTPFSDNYSDVIGIGEQYDLENASIIAPSDLDLAYRYKGFRNGRESCQPQIQHRHAPLARISPSVSELTVPRILTLQDLSPQRMPPCPPPSMAPPPPPPLTSKRQLILTSNLDHNDDVDNSDDSLSCSEFSRKFKLNKKPRM